MAALAVDRLQRDRPQFLCVVSTLDVARTRSNRADVGVKDMPFRFITKSIHAYLIDYPVAIVLMVAPFLLKLGQSGPVAVWLSVATGAAALLLAALTDHPTGLIRVIPYWLHLWVDRAVGMVFIIAPFIFQFTGLDAWYYWVLAAAVLLTTSVFNAAEVSVGQRARFGTRRAM
jgi:hypothetical protein